MALRNLRFHSSRACNAAPPSWTTVKPQKAAARLSRRASAPSRRHPTSCGPINLRRPWQHPWRLHALSSGNQQAESDEDENLPSSASIVIVGSGVVGCSAAYHLACERGWENVLVVDQGPLFKTGGSTSHAPGLVFQTNPDKLMCELAQATVSLFSAIGSFNAVGSLEVARTPERMAELHRRLGLGRSFGVEDGSILNPEEAASLFPLLDPSKILGALHVPSDGLALAVDACESMAASVCKSSATNKFVGDCKVLDVEVEDGKVVAVLTSRGRVATEQVLVSTGIWGPLLTRLAGFEVPLSPVEHQYAETAPLGAFKGAADAASVPMVRDQDCRMYFKQHWEGLGIGSYDHDPLLVEPSSILSPQEAPVMPSVRPFTSEHWSSAWEASKELIPALSHELEDTVEDDPLKTKFNGLMSFTADGNPVLGPLPGVEGFWVAVAVWVTHSGGVGSMMADWIADGAPPCDIHNADVARFHPHELCRNFVTQRAAQQYREVYDIIHPLQQKSSPRPMRCSPFYGAAEALGAEFFCSGGWEVPRFYKCNEARPAAMGAPVRDSWSSQNWSPAAIAEHVACRETAALFDLTSLHKLEVSGPGSVGFLQGLCTAQMDVAVGRVVYILMLSNNGGVLADLTVTRLAHDRFLVMTGGSVGPVHQAHIREVLRRHVQADPTAIVSLQDVSSQYCSLGLWGPQAEAVLEAASSSDVSGSAIPYFRSAAISIGSVPTLALRISYAGEAGWELHAPTEYGKALWEALVSSAEASGVDLVPSGTAALDSLRLEKGYRMWGADVDADKDPYESGLGFAVPLGTKKNGTPKKEADFVGRGACEALAAKDLSHQLCCLTLDDPGAVVLGKEPVLDAASGASGEPLGYVTSAAFSPTQGCCIAYAYLPSHLAATGTKVFVEYFDRTCAATVRSEPLYDPSGARVSTGGLNKNEKKSNNVNGAALEPVSAFEQGIPLVIPGGMAPGDGGQAAAGSGGGGRLVVSAATVAPDLCLTDNGRVPPVDKHTPASHPADLTTRLMAGLGSPAIDFTAEATYAQTRLPLEEAVTLDPNAYTSQRFYDAERENVLLKSWRVVAYADELKNPGDAVPVTVGGLSLVVTKSASEQLEAFFNTCKHRGHQLVESAGQYQLFSCPYHRWTYSLDGDLLGTPLFRGEKGTSGATKTSSGPLPEKPEAGSGPRQNKCFKKADYGLDRVRVEQWGMFILVDVSGEAIPLKEFLGDLYHRYDQHALEEWTRVNDEYYTVNANWKIAAENFMEYYHLPSVHPDLCKVSGVSNHLRDQGPGMYMGFKTYPLSDGGTPVDPQALPPAAGLDAPNQVTAHFATLFPNVAISVYPHSAYVVIMEPVSPGVTVERATLLVHPGIEASKDDQDISKKLTDEWAFWDQINREDITACESVQKGVQSPAYRGGRMVGHFEETIHRFQNMVIDYMTGNHKHVPPGDEAAQKDSMYE